MFRANESPFVPPGRAQHGPAQQPWHDQCSSSSKATRQEDPAEPELQTLCREPGSPCSSGHSCKGWDEKEPLPRLCTSFQVLPPSAAGSQPRSIPVLPPQSTPRAHPQLSRARQPRAALPPPWHGAGGHQIFIQAPKSRQGGDQVSELASSPRAALCVLGPGPSP